MRSHAAKYTACVMLACVAAVLVAVPVFGRTVTVTVVGAGDIARCDAPYDEQTAQLIGNILGSVSTPAQVITLGDNAYSSGTRAQFANCYDNYRLSDGSTYDSSRPAWWGQYKDRTMPSLGNHEYLNSTDPSIQSNPYFDYFSAQNGFKVPVAPVPNTTDNPGLTKGKGYYSYDLGSWHIVVLNSNCDYVSCDSVSAQATWLQNDLVAHPAQCTLAYMHHPLYATGTGGLEPRVKPLWQILYNNGADVILNGHDHRYERLARIDPNDNKDLIYGMRPLIAGTGGDPGGGTTDTNEPNSEIKIFGTAGILRMDLSDGYYSWAFIAADGTPTGEVVDSTANPLDPNFGAENPPNSTNPAGTEACHGAPGSADTTPPDTVIDSGPSGTVKTRVARFTFSSTEPSNATFQTRLDGGNWEANGTATSKTYSQQLPNGTHTFNVKATDAAGNTDPTPASRTWKVRAR
jgi:acid phosphatase type 7